MSNPYATLEDMQVWADTLMASRPADFVIGEDYLERWFVIPRNEQHNTYLHRFGRSDDDRAMHDHPWKNMSYVLHGAYREHTPDGIFDRFPGDVVEREATAIHRIELITPSVISLFVTGPKVRDWGFHCPNKGFVPWQDFVAVVPGGNVVGRGCE